MAIIKDQKGLAAVLSVSQATVYKWVNNGMPSVIDGLTYFFDSKEVSKWLRTKDGRKYGHLATILDKYEG